MDQIYKHFQKRNERNQRRDIYQQMSEKLEKKGRKEK